jgi:bifunctional UDP-N-acetylglucosamine pyrophosphorylase / glucosamine-1-phosphate N-acetyltransferase
MARASATPIIQRHLVNPSSRNDDILMTTASTQPLSVVIMAAGKGTRMKSNRPKVLHPLAGQPLLQHVLNAVAGLHADKTLVIIGSGADAVRAHLKEQPVRCVLQEPQHGTGHAVQQVVPHLADSGTTLILNGDVPLIEPATAAALANASGGTKLALLTIELADPAGYGRIVREGSAVKAIVEHKDASAAERAIREIYTGMLAAPTAWLKRAVMALKNHNAQKEYYLTDIVAMAVAEGVPVVSASATNETEVLGVNSPMQLADLERRLQRRQADALMQAGVRMADPARFEQRGTLACGQDVSIDVGCVFEGEVRLGDNVGIGPYCVIRNSVIEAGAQLQAFTHLTDAVVGERAEVGPFSRLRPGAKLGAEVHIGNFVEVKNSTLAQGAKANHLAYLGDATVGSKTNVGAGTITCNYDGESKHQTVIGDNVFVGSNSTLVAPLSLADGAYIAAGSAVTKNVPAGALGIGRARQENKEGWRERRQQKAKS